MEVDHQDQAQPKPKKKKKPMMKLKIPEENNIPTDSAMGVGEEAKADDSIQSTRSNISKQSHSFLKNLIQPKQITIYQF